RVVQQPGKRPKQAGLSARAVLRDPSSRRRRVHEGRVVTVRVVEREAERAAVLDQRAAQRAAEAAVPRGSLLSDERVLAVHRAVVAVHAHARAQRTDARLRDDLDAQTAGQVVLCGELIARDAYGLDLCFRRKLLTFEAVDPD